jgi:hypothetical protein
MNWIKKVFSLVLGGFCIVSCTYSQKGKALGKYTPEQDYSVYQTYESKLNATKKLYPFDKWKEMYIDEDTKEIVMPQYIPENCDKAQKVLDDLINKILNIGEEGKKAEKIAAFKYAVLTLNKMNEDIDGLIETVEREDLCILFDEIAFVAGLEPLEYGNGDGIASEWRRW